MRVAGTVPAIPTQTEALVLATRDDVYQNYPSTAPTRYETLEAAQSLA